MLVLGIESSCDETACAVVRDGREVLSNVVASQIEEHRLYGGVVPEIASRRHAEAISQIYRQALEEAGVPLEEIRKMQSGTHTVGDGMRRHLITLERDMENLKQSIQFCSALADCRERLMDLDAAALLAEMESMELSGTTFQNKQRQDVRIRYVAPVTITLLTVLLMGGLAALILWGTSVDPAGAPPFALVLVLMGMPAVVIGGVVLALFQRIQEIGKGEEDDARQF